MGVLLRIIRESLRIAGQELWKNKLRSMLSLSGITIGILCIIAVFSAVDSLERSIRGGIQSLGNNVVYIQKWPWEFSEEYPWWKYWKRPDVDYEEMEVVKEKSELATACAIIVYVNDRVVQFNNYAVTGVTVAGTSYEYSEIKEMEFAEGRYFTESEMEFGQSVVVLGSNVAEGLFPGIKQRVGKDVKFKGRKYKVIGILEKEGKDLMGTSSDAFFIIPYRNLEGLVDVGSNFGSNPYIAVKAKDEIPVDELKYELKGVMRSIRKLKPTEDDDFALNQVSILSDGISQLFTVLNIAGLCIGGFSIIVGGFGIANIMFVSVKERTRIIGVKKAMGARNAYILLEFLIEAVILCLVGGLLGLGLVFLVMKVLTLAIGADGGFEFVLSSFNIMLGISIAVITGIVAGIIPAWQASQMKPVDAIRK